ncbi:MAG: hypothetical protein P8046_12480 [Anaerolineales bacterium]
MFPKPNDLVLVAVIPTPADMEIARVLGWYRIPLRTAPKVVAVDWMAFYQPSCFGKAHNWQVAWAAPVRGHELVTRAELFKDQTDHPRANEEYFKVQLGSLVALPHPVVADKWKRLTFLYTTGERLLNAETLTDLTVHDEERTVLWQALRERALENQQYHLEEMPELPLGPEILALFGLLGGKSE